MDCGGRRFEPFCPDQILDNSGTPELPRDRQADVATAPVLKTVRARKGLGGSTPSLSAKSWKVNRPGGRGRLLTARGCKAWGSRPPPSANLRGYPSGQRIVAVNHAGVCPSQVRIRAPLTTALVGKLEKPSALEAEVLWVRLPPGAPNSALTPTGGGA